MQNNTILEVANLTKSFQPERQFKDILKLDFTKKPPIKALNDISFNLQENKTLCILGPNGSGKTTLLKIISTLLIADQGKVKIFGSDPVTDEFRIKSKIGLVSTEERSFYWRLSVRHNLEFFAAMYGMDKQTAVKRIEYLSAILDLKDQNKRFSSVSAGTKRKCSLIKALLHDPEMILLDEPSKSLDYQAALKLHEYIKKEKLSKKKTFLIATHNIDEAQELYDDFILLQEGRIISSGTRSENPNLKKFFTKDKADV